MKVTPFENNLDCYLKKSRIINFDDESIANLSLRLMKQSEDGIDYIKICYEYVRDKIAHSADANKVDITYIASDVLKEGHGTCFAKSHLLAALLRKGNIPTGLCYQKLILDDDTAPYLILHGLNGVYLKEYDKWIRLDPRGNKEGVNAQFSIDKEQLAFPIRLELGERDYFTVYPEPDKNVLKQFADCKNVGELWGNLPTELEYENRK